MLQDYNGYSGKDRNRVAMLQRKAIYEGTLPPPTKCEICGQTDGGILYHNEDYDEAIKGAHQLCIECHLRLHARQFKPNTWHNYLAKIARGGISKPYRTNSEFLRRNMGPDDPFRADWENPRDVWYRRLTQRPMRFRELPDDIKERIR
jgi:hypothetical protein